MLCVEAMSEGGRWEGRKSVARMRVTSSPAAMRRRMEREKARCAVRVLRWERVETVYNTVVGVGRLTVNMAFCELECTSKSGGGC